MARHSLERPATIALPGTVEALEGLHVSIADSEAPGAVIAPPHPLYGGSMESPVVTEMALACERAGVASLRFNWRGVGASAGEVTGDERVADVDYTASLDWLEATVSGPVTACGYSFGAAAAVRVAASRVRVRRLLLLAPPPSMLDPRALEAFGGEILVAVGDSDAFASWQALRDTVAPLPRSRFELVEGADHFFMTSLAEVGRITLSFLSR
jgi:alpha/beta superfamily hydrolase